MYFFFFKQKTAYEMRISDWSSDVCSSDLLSLDGPLGWLDRLLLDDASNGTFQLHSIQVGALAFTPGNIKQAEVREGDRPYASLLYEIGRASCRERVCQYV